MQRCGDVRGERVPGIVEAIVARPGFEEIAKNEQLLGRTRPTGKEIEEAAGDSWRLRRQVQVGNE